MKLLNSLLALTALSITTGNAQLTLTTDRNPMPGDRVVRYLMDTTGVFEGTSGANKTWNFESVIANGETTNVKYVNASATPFAAQFPTATVATEYIDEGDTAYAYFVTAATHFANLGMATPELAVVYSNAEVLMTFPFGYTSTFSDIHRASFELQEGITVERNGTINVTADAYGSITLPGGVTRSALRVKIIQERTDTTFLSGIPMFVMTFRATSYEWYTAANKFPVFGVSYVEINANGTASRHKSVVSVFHPSTVGVEDLKGTTPSTFSLHQNYPNPFNPSTTIRYTIPEDASVTLEVYNLVGQKVTGLVDNRRQQAGDRAVTFSGADLPSGVYMYRLTAGAHTGTRKLTVLK